ncbi:MAG: WecB/TagA/CpsF family glycosyltransferase, partial [Geminicoccales bacterium]
RERSVVQQLATAAERMAAPAPSAAVWGRVIGLPVAVGDMASISGEIIRRAQQGRGGYVCVANTHMLVTARREPAFREVVERAPLVVSDGAPLVWQLRRQGFAQARQVRGPDLMLSLCERAAEAGVPVYVYGGDEPLIADLLQVLARHAPGLVIAGAEAAPMLPWRPELDRAAVDRIRRSGARLVLVGLGCPKQEFWMQAHASHLDAVLIGVGQAFAVAAGRMPEAPLWMRQHGLEWLFRLVSEPRRLWRRYLVTNSLFIGYVLGEMAGFGREAPSASRS